jgi:hypothetical protein
MYFYYYYYYFAVAELSLFIAFAKSQDIHQELSELRQRLKFLIRLVAVYDESDEVIDTTLTVCEHCGEF